MLCLYLLLAIQTYLKWQKKKIPKLSLFCLWWLIDKLCPYFCPYSQTFHFHFLPLSCWEETLRKQLDGCLGSTYHTLKISVLLLWIPRAAKFWYTLSVCTQKGILSVKSLRSVSMFLRTGWNLKLISFVNCIIGEAETKSARREQAPHIAHQTFFPLLCKTYWLQLLWICSPMLLS